LIYNNNNVCRAFLRNYKEFLIEDPYEEITPEEKNIIITTQIKKMRGDTTKHKEKIVISMDQFWTLHNKFKVDQGKIMVLILFYCSLRGFELLKVTPSLFNWDIWLDNPKENGVLTIIGKRNKLRSIFVPNFVMEKLLDYITKNNIELDDRLFKFTFRKLNRILERAGKVSLGFSISSHVFRRSFATYLYEVGHWDLNEIKKHLGHADIGTTELYTKVSMKHLTKKYNDVVNIPDNHLDE
jgi:integrase